LDTAGSVLVRVVGIGRYFGRGAGRSSRMRRIGGGQLGRLGRSRITSLSPNISGYHGKIVVWVQGFFLGRFWMVSRGISWLVVNEGAGQRDKYFGIPGLPPNITP